MFCLALSVLDDDSCDPGASSSLRSHLPLATLFRACGAPAIQGRRPRCARTCPWLPYSAPAALLRSRGVVLAALALAPGYPIPRLRRCCDPGASSSLRSHLPLATLFRACGAAAIQGRRPRCARTCPWLPYSAPAALLRSRGVVLAALALAPGYPIPRLRRSNPKFLCKALLHREEFFYFRSSSFKVFSSQMRAFSTVVRSSKGSNVRGGPSRIFKEQKGTGLRAASHLCGSSIAG